MSDFVTNLFGGSSLTWTDLALAIAALVLAWLTAHYLSRGLRRLLAGVQGLSPWIADSADKVLRYFVLLLGFGVALAFLGANVQPLLAGVLIVVVVAALALRGVADNFGASVILQTRRPLQIGDDVESQGYRGIVTAINGRSVIIRTFDGREVHLPNSEILDGPLVNYSRGRGQRVEVEVRVQGERDDAALIASVSAVPGVLGDPVPEVLVTSAEPERTTVVVRFWHGSTGGPRATSDVVEALADALRTRSDAWAVVTPPPQTLRVPRTDV